MAALSKQTVVAVIGCGAMGQGIAQVAAQAGHQVLLYDAQFAVAEAAIGRIKASLGKLVEKGRLTSAEQASIVSRFSAVPTLNKLATARLVIEAVKEDLQVKQALFRDLEDVVGEKALLASNTSSISITAIGAALSRPERLAGLHFFNPAPVMQLVEVVSGLATDPSVIQTLVETAKEWGKTPAACRSTPGFIVNRVARPFYAEGLRLLQEGAGSPATLDAIMRDSGGFRMGPFELMDLIGHDVNFAVTMAVHQAYFGDPRFQPSTLQQELVAAGRLGRKSGRGFFEYGPDSRMPSPGDAEIGPAPRRITVEGDLGPAADLGILMREAGLAVETSQGPGRILVDGHAIALTDGRSATERHASDGGPSLILLDLAWDYRGARRIALTSSDGSPPEAILAAAGLFQAIGKAVSIIDDLPAIVVMRTVAMLANEAADCLLHQVANAPAIDLAMIKGVNYPIGPLAWADRLGLARVVTVLDHLAKGYGEDRYRASMALRRKAIAGGQFHV